MASKRRNARIAVMQTLFENDFHGRANVRTQEEILMRNLEEHHENVDSAYAHTLLTGISMHLEPLKKTIEHHAPQWPLERMDAIARSLLFIGGFELLYGEDAPPAVVMNEAIEIAKGFSEEEAGKFVNGVLNAIAKEKGK